MSHYCDKYDIDDADKKFPKDKLIDLHLFQIQH